LYLLKYKSKNYFLN